MVKIKKIFLTFTFETEKILNVLLVNKKTAFPLTLKTDFNII